MQLEKTHLSMPLTNKQAANEEREMPETGDVREL
jgi:hypothetical protein